jgi:hypothetical protein
LQPGCSRSRQFDRADSEVGGASTSTVRNPSVIIGNPPEPERLAPVVVDSDDVVREPVTRQLAREQLVDGDERDEPAGDAAGPGKRQDDAQGHADAVGIGKQGPGVRPRDLQVEQPGAGRRLDDPRPVERRHEPRERVALAMAVREPACARHPLRMGQFGVGETSA